jgi:tryptophanyl-tRNA synthetase
MARIFSGIKPTGELQLGNYLGALRNWVREQNPDALYCVVDLHALTIDIEPAEMHRASLETAVALLAVGLDPEICTIFVQSHVTEHAQLCWLLECVVTVGELRRMTQFKDKSSRNEVVRGGLFTYPVLMAADCFLYDTELVPVGDDQRQHLELARELAERFNNRFGETFVGPGALVPTVGGRVMDLQDPTRKMSKSEESPQGTILLFDEPDAIARKVRRAVTDTDGEVRYDPEKKPGVSNLLEILASLRDEDPREVATRYDAYGPLKEDLATAIIETLAPIKAKRDELLGDPDTVRALLGAGAERARTMASKKYAQAAAAMGLLAP